MAEEKRTYAILQENNDAEAECWYFFIKYQGNEENSGGIPGQ